MNVDNNNLLAIFDEEIEVISTRYQFEEIEENDSISMSGGGGGGGGGGGR